MSRTLQPEDQIAHYRVVGSLGVGGMGEVYVANDESLERNVALKVLPASLVRNQERVRRFVTEAKSASSLSHPHIVTIYEIGRDQVKSASGEVDPDSDPVHYISMELIQGETLQEKIHHEKTDLRTLLGYLSQVAEGLAKAHASGIVHRDLKPSNIMISRDGYAKVLDFGLAKLTERTQSDGGATLAATEVADLTGEGVVLGTVGYMSPEQVRGQAVDHRSDVFSFGCILYEAATRRRPFKADSDVETMHQILNQQPEAVEEFAPEVPNAVRRLIKRCLAKSPDKRLNSMKDIAIQLADIVEEFETLGHSGSASSLGAPAVETKRGLPMPAILGIVLFGLLGLAVGLWAITGGGGGSESADSQPFQSMEMSSLVSAQGIRSPVLSADGRYLAYVSGDDAGAELWVRQVATGSQVKVAGPEEWINRVSFSPDGNYIFFGMRDPETPNYTAIFSVPSLGGSPSKRLFDVDTAVSHAPDGGRVCFRRGVPQNQEQHLVIADLASGTERVRATVSNLLDSGTPVWSPDGRTIAWASSSLEGGFHSILRFYPVESDDDPREIRLAGGLFLTALAWLPESDALIASVGAIPVRQPQLSLVDAMTGEIRRITNDLNVYTSPSVAEDGTVVAAVRQTEASNLWTVGISGSGAAKQITFGSASESYDDLRSLPSGDILCSAGSGVASAIVRMAPDGSALRRLTPEGTDNFISGVAGDVVAFGRISAGILPHLWAMDADGGNSRQLTDGQGEIPGQVAPDGRHALFVSVAERERLWKQPLDGGEPSVVAEDVSGAQSAIFSGDGRFVLCTDLRQLGDRWVGHLLIYSMDGGDPVHVLPPPRPGISNARWSPGDEALSYQVPSGPDAANVYQIQLDGTGDRALTPFDEGKIEWHLWSPDGSSLFVDRRVGSSVGIWVQPFENGEPAGEARQLVNFPTGDIREMTWLHTRETLAFRHVLSSRDVVLVRNFR